MEHLNYCRQITRQFASRVESPSSTSEQRARLGHVIDLARLAQKFILPIGGHLFKDAEFRALDEDVPLKLPAPLIAIEFASAPIAPSARQAAEGLESTSGCVVFAREHDDRIVITYAVKYTSDGVWGVLPDASIELTEFIDRSAAKGGRVPMHVRLTDVSADSRNYGRPVGVLLGLLNALACSNVHMERSEPKKGVKVKRALPFDTYHVLMVDVPSHHTGGGAGGGSHRSPREHLRRGHIVRPDGRRPYWRNATVVNAGVGGKVSKDYALRNRAQVAAAAA